MKPHDILKVKNALVESVYYVLVCAIGRLLRTYLPPPRFPLAHVIIKSTITREMFIILMRTWTANVVRWSS